MIPSSLVAIRELSDAARSNAPIASTGDNAARRAQEHVAFSSDRKDQTARFADVVGGLDVAKHYDATDTQENGEALIGSVEKVPNTANETEVVSVAEREPSEQFTVGDTDDVAVSHAKIAMKKLENFSAKLAPSVLHLSVRNTGPSATRTVDSDAIFLTGSIDSRYAALPESENVEIGTVDGSEEIIGDNRATTAHLDRPRLATTGADSGFDALGRASKKGTETGTFAEKASEQNAPPDLETGRQAPHFQKPEEVKLFSGGRKADDSNFDQWKGEQTLSWRFQSQQLGVELDNAIHRGLVPAATDVGGGMQSGSIVEPDVWRNAPSNTPSMNGHFLSSSNGHVFSSTQDLALSHDTGAIAKAAAHLNQQSVTASASTHATVHSSLHAAVGDVQAMSTSQAMPFSYSEDGASPGFAKWKDAQTRHVPHAHRDITYARRDDPAHAFEALKTEPAKQITLPALAVGRPALELVADRQPSLTSDPVSLLGGSANTPFPSEAVSLQRPGQMAFASHPELPRHVAQQMTAALQANSERMTELLLNPAELGRVKISLSSGEFGLVVNVAAERSETLDLLRRHADQLTQEFKNIGYDTSDFTFEQNNSADSRDPNFDDRDKNQGDIGVADAELDADLQKKMRSVVSLDRVDVRV